jgi:hypothetical protein
MKKMRMTKAEKAFVEKISKIISANPEIRNGKRYIDRKAFNALPENQQKAFTHLILTKTR